MDAATASSLKKGGRVLSVLLVWAFLVWLLYPLITLNSVDLRKALEYFYRSAFGIIILIILLGKSIFDLLFPQDLSGRRSVIYVTLLLLYSFVLSAGIIFVAIRILLVYLNRNSSSFVGDVPQIP
jgi:hypothetical protein